jgi:uncharacterized protein
MQGGGHTLSYVSENIMTSGIMTTVVYSGFYLQDPAGDGKFNTADGMYVYAGSSVLDISVGG